MRTPLAAAFFGDYRNDRVFAVNNAMDGLVGTIATGKGPYPVDQAADYVLPITRGAKKLDVIAVNTLEKVGSIHLSHTPRSTAFRSSTGTLLVAGADRACISIVNLKALKIITVVGDQRVIPNRRDFGGSLASGHPTWVTDDKFLLLDRVSRTLALYAMDTTPELLDEINTPTSLHHVIRLDQTWYGCCEGNPWSHVPPSLLRFELSRNDKLAVTGNAWLPSAGKRVTDMGGHHIDFHPDKNTIYFGSAEGRIFVVNRHTLQAEKIVYTGSGTGHTGFSPERGLAFVINHTDSHITAIDSRSHEVIKNIPVASSRAATGKKSIGHTFRVDDSRGEFICLASTDGSLVRVDMDTLKVKATFRFSSTGSYPLQGCFVRVSPPSS